MELFEEFSQLTAALEKEGIDYALCGGPAMAVYAFPRATLDIDILIEPHTLTKAKSVAHALGFDIDAGLMHFRQGTIHIHRLTKLGQDSTNVLVLDLILSTPELQDVWENKQQVFWDRGKLPVVSKLGLIKMKSMRLSGQDQDDIKWLQESLNED